VGRAPLKHFRIGWPLVGVPPIAESRPPPGAFRSWPCGLILCTLLAMSSGCSNAARWQSRPQGHRR
jgi:hypothetical protein